MADPLSITSGVLSLLGVAWSVATELRKFQNDVSVVNKTVGDLEQDVEGLTRVLESMRDTFETITAEHGSGTGHVASHWSNLARSINDGKAMLQRLSENIIEINKTKSFLDGPRKQLRLNLAQERLSSFRIHIQSYRDGLQLSLQTIILWNQVSSQKAVDQVLPNLSDLHQDVRRIAMDLNQRIASLQSMVQSPQNEAEITSMTNLRECVRSAASIVSSTSTTVASQRGETFVPASDFGDCFPVEQNMAIQRWMDSKTTYESSEAASRATSRSVADISAFGESDEGSDSDSDLGTEITTLLLEDGKRKLAAGDIKAAERMLRNCAPRLAAMRISRKEPSINYARQLEAISHLLEVYERQRNLQGAQKMLQQRLAIKEKVVGKSDVAFLRDVLWLAQLLKTQGNLLEAQVYARRALRGFKKSGEETQVRECLMLLVDLCEQNEDDREAYSVMLLRTELGTASDATTSVSSITDQASAKAFQESEESDVATVSAFNAPQTAPSDSPDDQENTTTTDKAAGVQNRPASISGLIDSRSVGEPNFTPTAHSLAAIPTSPQAELQNVEQAPHDGSVAQMADEVSLAPQPSVINEGLLHSGPQAQTAMTIETQDTHAASEPSCEPNKSSHDVTNISTVGVADTPTTISPSVSLTKSSKGMGIVPAKTRRKIVIVGPTKVGKSALVIRQYRGDFQRGLIPTVFENLAVDVVLEGQTMELSLWDTHTAGSLDYDRLRTLSCVGAHCVLICFNIRDRESLQVVYEQWIQEVKSYCKDASILLVGCQADLRHDPEFLGEHVTPEEGRAVRGKIEAEAYMECSAKTGEGVDELFRYAARLTPIKVARYGWR